MPTVEFNRQTTISFPDSNIPDITRGIQAGSLAIREILGTDGLKFGEINANSFQCIIHNCPNIINKKIQVKQTDNGVTRTLFEGYVDSCKLDDFEDFRTIVAYDYLYKARKKSIKKAWKAFWKDRKKATVKQIYEYIFEYYSIDYTLLTHDEEALPFDSLEIKKTKSLTKIKKLYLSTFLAQLGELNMCVPNMDRTGMLELVCFSDIQFRMSTAVDIRGQYAIKKSQFEDFSVPVYDEVEIVNEAKNLEVQTGEGSHVLSIQNNLFLYSLNESVLTEIAYYIKDRLTRFTYIPANIEMKVSDLTIYPGDFVRTAKGLCLVCENNYSGSLLVNQNIISSYDTGDNEGVTLGNTTAQKEQTTDYKVDTKSTNFVDDEEILTSGSGDTGDLYIDIQPKSGGSDGITGSGGIAVDSQTGDDKTGFNVRAHFINDKTQESLYAVFDGLIVGKTYTFNMDMSVSGIMKNWGNYGYAVLCTNVYIAGGDETYDTYRVPRTPGGTVTQIEVGSVHGFGITVYYDNDTHNYNQSFTAISETVYINIDLSYLQNVYSGIDRDVIISNFKIMGGDGTNPGATIKAVNVDGTWEDIKYAKNVEQVQTSGRKIATVKNNDGTTTDIYAPKGAKANVQADASALLNKLEVEGVVYQAHYTTIIPTLQTGTKIADFIVDDVPSVLYAPTGGGGGASALSELTDVLLSNLTAGQILKYTSQGIWVNAQEQSSGATILNELGDVSISNPASNQILKYNGSNWINSQIDYGDLLNKPSINSVSLAGNKTSSDLGIVITLSQVEYDALTQEQKLDENKVYYITDSTGEIENLHFDWSYSALPATGEDNIIYCIPTGDTSNPYNFYAWNGTTQQFVPLQFTFNMSDYVRNDKFLVLNFSPVTIQPNSRHVFSHNISGTYTNEWTILSVVLVQNSTSGGSTFESYQVYNDSRIVDAFISNSAGAANNRLDVVINNDSDSIEEIGARVVLIRTA